MADVFISYARSDVAHAANLSSAFEKLGWSVFWDGELVPGERFASRLKEELATAKCVMVLWSKSSAGSDWVRDEAGEGRDRGILVPVRIDDNELPLGFRQIHATSLMPRNGLYDAEALLSVARRVCFLVGEANLSGRMDALEERVYDVHDLNALKLQRKLFERAAFRIPCVQELFIVELVQAIDDTVLALNTGHVRTREGGRLSDVPAASAYRSKKFREAAKRMSAKFAELKRIIIDFSDTFSELCPNYGHHRNFFAMVVAIKRLHGSSEAAAFVERMDRIDATRNELIGELNKLLVRHGEQPLDLIETSSELIDAGFGALNLRTKDSFINPPGWRRSD
jgi:hypothetical protein